MLAAHGFASHARTPRAKAQTPGITPPTLRLRTRAEVHTEAVRAVRAGATVGGEV
jgi:hypothetical protein